MRCQLDLNAAPLNSRRGAFDSLTLKSLKQPGAAALFVLLAGASAYALWRWLKSDVEEIEVDRPKSKIEPEPKSVNGRRSEPEVQSSDEGYGPYFHRIYTIDIDGSTLSATELIDKIKQDPNLCSPTVLATFEKTKTAGNGTLNVGDEFYIRISGPWDGPVRVVHVTPESFTFATLQGHLEAGGIRFTAEQVEESATGQPSTVHFKIESWSRSKDPIVDLAYDKLKAARFAQTQMWAKFCESVAKTCDGKPAGAVKIKTERAEQSEQST